MAPSDAGFLRRCFVNANAVLAVVGGVSEEALRAALARHVAKDRARASRRRRLARVAGAAGRSAPAPTAVSRSWCASSEVDPSPKNLLALGVALDLVGADPDSTLFQAVREKPRARLRGFGRSRVGQRLAPRCCRRVPVPAVPTVLRIIDEVLQRSAKEGFAAADLARARKKTPLRLRDPEGAPPRPALARRLGATGFPSIEDSERIVAGLDDETIHGGMAPAVAGRSLVAALRD